MFRRNITLGHRFWSRKLSRKVNCWRAEFTGELSRSNGIKNWRLYLPTAYSWSKERREQFFFFGNWRKDTSWWFWIESRKRWCKMLYFVTTELSSRACYFESVGSSYIISCIFYLSLNSVVRRPISANMWLSFNFGIFSFCSKTFSWITYSILFRADLEHPIIEWEN